MGLEIDSDTWHVPTRLVTLLMHIGHVHTSTVVFGVCDQFGDDNSQLTKLTDMIGRGVPPDPGHLGRSIIKKNHFYVCSSDS